MYWSYLPIKCMHLLPWRLLQVSEWPLARFSPSDKDRGSPALFPHVVHDALINQFKWSLSDSAAFRLEQQEGAGLDLAVAQWAHGHPTLVQTSSPDAGRRRRRLLSVRSDGRSVDHDQLFPRIKDVRIEMKSSSIRFKTTCIVEEEEDLFVRLARIVMWIFLLR